MQAPPYDDAPCGLLLLRLDGSVLAANRTFCAWTGRSPDELRTLRLPQLLSVGGRIYWETHLAPLLHVDRSVEEVALELHGPGGRRPVLLSATVGADGLVHAALSQARERSRYERELLAARTAADLAATRLTALQAVTAALSRALGLSAVGDALLDAAVGPLGAAAATLWLASDEGLRPYAARGEAVDARPSLEVEVEVDGRLSVPLPGARAVQGVLSLRPRTGAGTDPLDPELLLSVGQQAGLALDRAILHEQSAAVAHELQHALLAVDPPVDTRFAVATTYRAGIEMLEVGGDWYDVFLAEEGVLSVVVGDVVGRGLAAASAMGQLRSATRAVSDAGRSPAAVLERLDRFVEQVPAAAFATVVHAQLDLATGLVRLACAGHPPPVLVPRSAPPRLVWGGRSTPLGAFPTPQRRTDTTVQLAPGDRLLLYTDGLVERRDSGLDERLDVLEQASADLVGPPLDDAVSSLVARLLVDEQHRDDVCVLLLEWAGPVFERRLPADLRTLAEVRHDLRRWLADRGLDHRMSDDVVLATSEALANAAEHGSGGRPSARVHLQVRLEQDPDGGSEVVVRVSDTGRWQPEGSSSERGRGLTIARALVDDVVVETGEGTSVLLRRRLTAAAS
jgi:anti-sigma regulatory factor (Ser/Thr protein kinase)